MQDNSQKSRSRKFVVGGSLIALAVAAGGLLYIRMQAASVCGAARAEADRWTALESRYPLIESGQAGPMSGAFGKLMKSGALFKARLRDQNELKVDLQESFASMGLQVVSLALEAPQSLPTSAPEGEQFFVGTLAVTEFLTVKPSDVFVLSKWRAQVGASQAAGSQGQQGTPNVTELVKKWAEENAPKAKVGLRILEVRESSPQETPLGYSGKTAFVSFEAGMIPAMSLPRRTLPELEKTLAPWEIYAASHSAWPAFLVERECVVKSLARARRSFANLQSRAGEKLLSQLERFDRVIWMAEAEKQSHEWMVKSGLLQEN